jgi:hypothetical protein
LQAQRWADDAERLGSPTFPLDRTHRGRRKQPERRRTDLVVSDDYKSAVAVSRGGSDD